MKCYWYNDISVYIQYTTRSDVMLCYVMLCDVTFLCVCWFEKFLLFWTVKERKWQVNEWVETEKKWFDLIWFDLIWFDLIWFDSFSNAMQCNAMQYKFTTQEGGKEGTNKHTHNLIMQCRGRSDVKSSPPPQKRKNRSVLIVILTVQQAQYRNSAIQCCSYTYFLYIGLKSKDAGMYACMEE